MRKSFIFIYFVTLDPLNFPNLDNFWGVTAQEKRNAIFTTECINLLKGENFECYFAAVFKVDICEDKIPLLKKKS